MSFIIKSDVIKNIFFFLSKHFIDVITNVQVKLISIPPYKFRRNVEYEYRPPLSYHEAVERLRRAFERETMERLERGAGQEVVPRLGAEPGATGQSAFRPWSPQPGPSRAPPPTTVTWDNL